MSAVPSVRSHPRAPFGGARGQYTYRTVTLGPSTQGFKVV